MTFFPDMLIGLLAGAAIVGGAAYAHLRDRARLRAELSEANLALRAAENASSEAQGRLVMLEEKLPETVEAIAAKALDANREAFLSEAGLKVGATVAPVTAQLDAFKKLVDAMESKRTEEGGRLGETLRSLSDTTGSLATALGSAQTRGRWGEWTLENILGLSGLHEGIDFERQASGDGGRPDIVVNVPGGTRVVIDAKAPFDAFEAAATATTDQERIEALSAFAKRVREHVTRLGQKAYFAHVQPSPDFVLLFLPGDAYLAAAEEHDRELFQYALERGVVIATPRTVVVFLRTVRIAWQDANASDNARKVLTVAAELHDRLKTYADHLSKVGRGLESAVRAYNQAAGSYGTRVLVSARRLEALATTKEPLPEVAEITEHSSGSGATDLVEDDPDTP